MRYILRYRGAGILAGLVMLMLCAVQAYGNNSVSHSPSDSVVPKGQIIYVGKGLYTKISMVVKNMFLR